MFSDPLMHLSPVEQVVQLLTSKKDVSFAYLVANVEVGKELVSPYTTKAKTNQMLTITFESNVTNNGKCQDPKNLMAVFQDHGNETKDVTCQRRHTQDNHIT